MMRSILIVFPFFLSPNNRVTSLVILKTSTCIESATSKEVYNFIATPANWPKIVLSSWEVQGSLVNKPAKRKDPPIQEVFGLPPILPLSVSWTCDQSALSNRNGQARLDFRSTEGVQGLASNCRMLFDIQPARGMAGGVNVTLRMEYEPESLFSRLAIPILTVENAIALKIALPNALAQQRTSSASLEKFQKLMGSLYGVAGLVHLVDCLLGDSQLLRLAGCPSFWELPAPGQALALLWCFSGPAAFILSRTLGLANYGLISYGVVEITSAAVAQAYTMSSGAILAESTIDPLLNAIAVQIVVALSWLYSQSKTDS